MATERRRFRSMWPLLLGGVLVVGLLAHFQAHRWRGWEWDAW
jgi:Antenna complex alpha/beta subunit